MTTYRLCPKSQDPTSTPSTLCPTVNPREVQVTEQEAYEDEFSEPLGDHPEFKGQCVWCGMPDDLDHPCTHTHRRAVSRLFEHTFERVNDSLS